MAAKILREIIRIFGKKDPLECVLYEGYPLPLTHVRRCSSLYKNDHYYVSSAEKEAQRLKEELGINCHSKVLDIGCSYGRLALGILRVIGELQYEGIDVDRNAINWCRHYLEPRHRHFRFTHINVRNERYNPQSEKRINELFRFPFNNNIFDLVYAYSVFSHMLPRDVQVYLHESRRVLKDEGEMRFTAYVEENVDDVSINPENYLYKQHRGSLHVVRYEKEYFASLCRNAGLSVSDIDYQTENKQSLFRLKVL